MGKYVQVVFLVKIILSSHNRCKPGRTDKVTEKQKNDFLVQRRQALNSLNLILIECNYASKKQRHSEQSSSYLCLSSIVTLSSLFVAILFISPEFSGLEFTVWMCSSKVRSLSSFCHYGFSKNIIALHWKELLFTERVANRQVVLSKVTVLLKNSSI